MTWDILWCIQHSRMQFTILYCIVHLRHKSFEYNMELLLKWGMQIFVENLWTYDAIEIKRFKRYYKWIKKIQRCRIQAKFLYHEKWYPYAVIYTDSLFFITFIKKISASFQKLLRIVWVQTGHRHRHTELNLFGSI